MIDDIKKDAESRMKKSIEALETALKRVRTGRAHPSLLDTISVSYYGSDTPLSQLANISVEEGRTLLVSPFDKQLVPDIERAILKSDLGLNPSTAGTVIRLPLPPLTEETRRDLVKVVRSEGEQAKVSIRNIRRDANGDLKDLLKEKEVSEDDARRGEEAIQQLTDRMVGEVDKLLKTKEEDLMSM
ncbi:ribosome-recycling factor [Isoalcanivorax pacificus W11-5]|uniref:Ribosome-recycling factor n=1 Tax=Isoalcanivorax pacificus W11-5 TaxID=391936 RepID=A0A0B4XKL7_9GAMM|nr:ribosome recycling factor [Isoalcanivorax pacificus]AJD48829.1 ribosome-recycling factor [Isoalcanivorax pacificus W11-5]